MFNAQPPYHFGRKDCPANRQTAVTAAQTVPTEPPCASARCPLGIPVATPAQQASQSSRRGPTRRSTAAPLRENNNGGRKKEAGARKNVQNGGPQSTSTQFRIPSRTRTVLSLNTRRTRTILRLSFPPSDIPNMSPLKGLCGCRRQGQRL